MTSFPTALYQCGQVKAMDKAAVEIQEVSGFELMQRAGQRAFDLLRDTWPQLEQITVFCGAGNNAGDGYIVAALAAQAGLETQVLTLIDPQRLSGDARAAYKLAESLSVPINDYLPNHSRITGVVVDALLGIGISGNVRDAFSIAIANINASKRPVLAIDIPSGICGDTGRVLGSAVNADTTITFIGMKQGMFTAQARNYCGDIVYADLGITDDVFDTQIPSCERLSYTLPLLSSRAPDSHKGLFGRALVVGGDKHYGGAAIMAAEAAMRSGAGLVSLATRAEHVSAALARRPELMVSAVESAQQLDSLLEQTQVIVLGPGIGQTSWSNELFERVLMNRDKMLIDADGLNILARKRNDFAPRDNWVLTPHPAEAARLLDTSTAEIQADRFSAAMALRDRYGGVIVLKGAGTIIADHRGLSLCSAGNPSMSTAGMGDVLSGIIGGLLAQGLSLSEAAKRGVWAHATAADTIRDSQGKHMLATDLYVGLHSLW